VGSLVGDLRYAARSLLGQPTFTSVALLTLVLGIGANTAVFSVIKAVLLNHLPYADASRLVVVREQNPDGTPDLVSAPTYLDWKEQSSTIDGLAAFRHVTYAFAGRGQPLDVPSVRVTPNLFETLASRAVVGRTFTTAEGEPGADHVAVLSRAFWQRHFGGSTSAIGQSIQLDAEPYTVVGIMAADFDFPPSGNIDIWTPLSFDPKDVHGRSRRARALNVIGRLADGQSEEQARRELAVLASRLAATYPESNAGWGALVTSVQEQLVTTVRPALMLILGAVGFLLLIVCANLANLMLARLSGRRTEIAVRAALGAGRAQLIRQVLAESLLLSAVGGALGIAVAWAGVRFVRALPQGSLPRMDEVRLDGGVLLFAAAISILVAIVFALVPALHASKAGLRDTIKAFSGVTSGPGSSRLLGAIVVIEVALALVLLVGAGLMTRSFAQLMRVSPGFEPANLLAVQVYLPQTRYRDGTRRTQFFAETIDRVRALPGVRSAAAVSSLPMYPVGIDFALPFTIEGATPPPSGEEPRADIRSASPGYFETMRVPLVRGRFLDDRDRAGAPGVLVINETMARRHFAGQDPLGRVVGNPHGKGEVVGVVGDVKHYGLDSQPRPEIFMPVFQQPFSGMTLVVRTSSDPMGFVDAVRREVMAVDAEQPIYDARAVADIVAQSVFLPRISMLLVGAFAVSALLLAVVGIYGVVSYSVTERTRELGVRMALGAESRDTMRLVLGRSMLLVACGVAAGLVASLVMMRAISGLLFEVSPLDPTVFAGVSLLLALSALLASLVPAWRATQVDPIVALRVD
jgi:putative ABC transport system permease protein